MKQMNIDLPQDLLPEATRLSGEKTYSRAVVRAFEEFVRRPKARQMVDLRALGLWDGDFAVMRRDHGARPLRR